MLIHPMVERLRGLGLAAMADAFTEMQRNSSADDLSREDWLGLLIDRETTAREGKRLSRRLSQARLRQNAVIEDADLRTLRGLDRSLFQKLVTCGWIRDSQHLLIGGPTGVGKSWLACALGHKACRDGFSVIPYNELLRSVAARIVDRHVLRLIKSWLKAPVEETDPDGRRRMSGGKQSTCGTPQGGVISPLLANRYMNRFLRHWRHQGRGELFRAHVVNYADDFVILSRGYAEEALAWTRQVMTRLGLTMNEAKTSVRDARQEHFDFLGYSFGPHHYRKDGHWYLGASPSQQKSVQRLKARVGEIMIPSNVAPWDEVRGRLNRLCAAGQATLPTARG